MSSEQDSCSYKIHLSNRSIENTDDGKHSSSASNFRVVLDDALNLNSRIFLRSMTAEMSLEDLHVYDIPLTITKKDFITLQLEISPSAAESNIHITPSRTTESNNKIYHLSLTDFTTISNDHFTTHINKQMDNKINLCLIGRYLEIFTDSDIFNHNFDPTKTQLTRNEIDLCMYYTQLTFFYRQTVLEILDLLIDKPTETVPAENQPAPPAEGHYIPEDEPDTMPTIGPLNQAMTKGNEKSTLEKSEYLLRKNQRTTGRRKLFSLDSCANLANSAERNTLKDNFEPVFVKFLQDSDYLAYEGTGPNRKVTQEKQKQLKDLKERNIELMKYGEKCHQLLQLITNPKAAAIILKSNILSITPDKASKAQFNMHPESFLVKNEQSRLTVKFYGHIAYALGTDNIRDILTLNLRNPPTEPNDSKLRSDNINNSNQRLQSPMRTQPKLIHALFDIISNDCHHSNLWLRDTEYEDFFIVTTISHNTAVKQNRCISKQSNDRIFYKIRQARNFLDNIQLVLCDENFRQVNFPLKTYCDYAICVRPCISD